MRLGASGLGYKRTRNRVAVVQNAVAFWSLREVPMSFEMAAFKKRIYSGTCLRGHSYEDHHLGLVLNPEARALMGPHRT